MMDISERSFENAIEQGLLQHGPDAPEGDFYVRSGPGSVRLTPDSARDYIRTRFSPGV